MATQKKTARNSSSKANTRKNNTKAQNSNTKAKNSNSKNKSSKASSTRNTTKKSNIRKTQTNKKANQSFDMKREITILTTIILSIFLVVAMYFNTGAIVGNYIRILFFGLFGIGAYFIPVLVIMIAILSIAKKDYERYTNKLILSFFLIVAFSTLAHIILIDSEQITDIINDKSAFFPSLSNYFQLSGDYRRSGGLIGGFMGDIIVILIDKFGGILITSLIIAALIIVIFETSIISFFLVIYRAVVRALKWIFNHLVEVKNSLDDKRSEREKQRALEASQRKDNRPDKDSSKKDEDAKKKDNFLDKSTMANKASKADKGAAVNETNTYQNDNKESSPNKLDNIQISLFNNKENKPSNKPEKAVVVEEKSFDIEYEIKESESGSPSKTLYEYPPIDLLKEPPDQSDADNKDEVRHNAQKLQDTLESFGVGANVVNVSCGPTVTRYELQPEVGVKVSKIVNLTDDIALNLAASGIRIEAPIPGKALIGIEVPNKSVKAVFIKEVISSNDFLKFPSKIAFVVGKDISGETIIADIGKMPHMLISGATGSGKSVCINTLITSILFRAHPDEVKLLMIDPKVVELKVYNGIPHLLIPVVTDPKKAAGALYWAVKEMEERYQLFAAANVRDLTGYNKAVEEKNEGKKLPQIVVIVDELADLMQVAAKEVEDAICRLAQMARAAGIHLILATQRPSVDVITGIIKANIPSRIAFSVSSGVDSRTIIDMNGAEKLVGKGDMLYYPIGMNKPLRVQGAFISDHEVENIVNFLKATEKAEYDSTIIEQINKVESKSAKGVSDDELDEYFEQALELVIDKQKASASMIQRRFKVGFNRASRIVEQLFEAGYIGDEEGSKPRKVLYTQEDYYNLKHSGENSVEDSETVIEEKAN